MVRSHNEEGVWLGSWEGGEGVLKAGTKIYRNNENDNGMGIGKSRERRKEGRRAQLSNV